MNGAVESVSMSIEHDGERAIGMRVRCVERALPSLMHVDQHKGIITKQFEM